MRQCHGCFAQINDLLGTCPYCGYIEGSPVQNKLFLSPGTTLAGRYKIGKIIKSDLTNAIYLAWDNTTNNKVKIREYLPVDCVTRDTQTNCISAHNEKSNDVFNKGYIQFVDEAKRLFRENGNVKIYDCIAENNTAYMILEYTEEKIASGGKSKTTSSRTPRPMPSKKQSNPAKKDEKPRIAIIKSEEKENRIYEFKRKFSLIPIWVKILVSSVIIIGIVVAVIISSGIFKKPVETEATDLSETSESTEETEATLPVVSLLKVKSISFNGHTYAYYTDADSWEAAEEVCESMGGHLAVITSKEENDALWAFALSVGNESAFIGLSDAKKEGNWKWITGESLSYTNWAENQPDGYTNEENYGEFSFSEGYGLWNDYPFATHDEVEKTGFICEWEYDVSNPVAEEALTTDEALLAFQYHIANTLIEEDKFIRASLGTEVYSDDEDDYSETSLSNWNLLKDNDDLCIFYYETKTGECFVFYTDLYTGVTTSIKYETTKCEVVLSIGESDYNAFDNLLEVEKYTTNSSAKELKDYMHKNIRMVANDIGDLADGSSEDEDIIEYYNDYIYLSTSSSNTSEDLIYIQLSDQSGDYSLYGLIPGMSFEDSIFRIVLAGAETATRTETTCYVVTFKDGTTVTITTDDNSETISQVAANRE